MCRLLLLFDPNGIDPNPALEAFRRLSRNSREFQGHGWGCCWRTGEGQWSFHHSIQPVWADGRDDFPSTPLFLAHARSAFRDEGIKVDNNMPFTDGRNVFIFNGELRGVKVKATGRIGAEKIFNTIKRFDKGDMADAVRRGVDIIVKRTRYVRAMNFILATPDDAHVCSLFNEDPDYFQLQTARIGNTKVICSERFEVDGDTAWSAITNKSFQTIALNPPTS